MALWVSEALFLTLGQEFIASDWAVERFQHVYAWLSRHKDVLQALAAVLGTLVAFWTSSRYLRQWWAGKIVKSQGLPEMVNLRPGQFIMGASREELKKYNEIGKEREKWESPQHPIKIQRAFSISRYPVTFAEWQKAVEAAGFPELSDDDNWGKDRRPAINVSWDDAQKYVEWLRKKTGKPYRLPSEAEWEYACRAGTTTAFYFGDFISSKVANFRGKNVEASGKQKSSAEKTMPVNASTANGFRLQGMHGNVWEWVEDCWHVSYDRAPANQKAWIDSPDESPDLRVIRGGSWKSVAKHIRSATRGKCLKYERHNNIGFRVAMDL